MIQLATEIQLLDFCSCCT